MHDDVKGYVPVSLFPPSSKLIFFTSWIVSDQFERNETSFLLNNFENNFFLQLENNYFGRVLDVLFERSRLEERAKKRATLEICLVHDEKDECFTSVDYAMENLEKMEYKWRHIFHIC